MRILQCLAAVLVVATSTAGAQANGLADRMYWGGGIGLGFGSVDFVDVSPMIGLDVTDQVSTGLQLTFRYRNDDRYSPSLSTTDYGGRLFARYRFLDLPVFLQAEYEHLSYEFVRFNGSTGRTGFDGFFAGGGYSQPLGPNGALFVSALYNFNHDSSDPFRPYDDPWTVRFGVSFGF